MGKMIVGAVIFLGGCVVGYVVGVQPVETVPVKTTPPVKKAATATKKR